MAIREGLNFRGLFYARRSFASGQSHEREMRITEFTPKCCSASEIRLPLSRNRGVLAFPRTDATRVCSSGSPGPEWPLDKLPLDADAKYWRFVNCWQNWSVFMRVLTIERIE